MHKDLLKVRNKDSITYNSISIDNNFRIAIVVSDNEALVGLSESVAEVTSGAMRQLAEEKGYKVTWHHETKTVILEKGETTFVFTLGKKEYTYNGKTQQLSEAIKVVNEKVYASDEVSSLL